MKKFYRIAVLVLIFCLCFTTAVFGADAGQNAVPANQENLFRCGHLPFAPDHEFQLVTLDDVAWRSGEYSETPITEKIPSKYPHFNTPAETPLLVLVLEFSNMNYQNSYDWGNTIFQGDHSLAQYYKDMSFNQFSFVPAKETSAYNVGGNHNTKDRVNDGVVHITVNANHGCWNLKSKTENMKWINCLVEGIKKADTYVDFSTFDKNNDGEITTDEMALAVVVAGYEAAFDPYLTQYKSDLYLWSHAWNIYSGWWEYFQSQYPDWEDFLPCPDGVYVDSYIAIAEHLQKNRQEPINVLAHELGHYLGLPDLYDTDYGSDTWSTYDVSDLSVMCSGSWGWNNILNDYMPVAFDAWSRSCLGWVIPETVSTGTHNVVSDKGSAYNVLRVETGVSGDYYLLENREISGWDQGLNTYQSYAPNGGLVCWHIDDAIYNQYSGSNSVNNSDHRPGVMPLYPESENNKITFIGTLSSDGLTRPFFTYDIWNSDYSGILDCIDFPTYNKSNDPFDRTFSGVQMTILPTPGSHTVRVNFGEVEYNDIIRLSGQDRYDTAIAAAEELKEVNGWDDFQKIILASGADFPDALSASYLAYVKDAPVLLVGKDNKSIAKITSYINENLASGGTVYIIGGTGAVLESVENSINGTVERLAGSDRFATNLEVLKEAGVDGEELLIASGMNYADALSASAAARPIFLVGRALTKDQKDYLDANKGILADTTYVIGGPGAVDDSIKAEVEAYTGEAKRLEGSDRFATSVAVANEFFPGDVHNMVIASGLAFPDGLSGGPVAIAYDAPLVLVGSKWFDHATNLFIAKKAGTLIVMGGKGAVSQEIAETIAAPARETA